MQMMSHAIQTTGGYALKYAASTMNRVKKIESLKDAIPEEVYKSLFTLREPHQVPEQYLKALANANF